MFRHSRLMGIILFMAGLVAGQSVCAHAALIVAETAQAIRLHAQYDTGAPMSHAQVIIYAPDNPASPWGQGVTDRAGRFEFIPDATEGRWSLQVRQAGHGVMAHVQIGGVAPVVITATGAHEWLQRLVMVALVAWGGLGTALFVLRNRGRRDASA
ncbi:MAG: carboxypeptidase-like regulatory domain-containing protein [Roseinatronobacter sp.]|jgi:nickel transport protein|nr:carboxypeptidase-like regulatory domain-containing protein [Roseinatronobacter sp.]